LRGTFLLKICGKTEQIDALLNPISSRYQLDMRPTDIQFEAIRAQHQQELSRDRLNVERCHEHNAAVRTVAENAQLHSDLAMKRALELSRRLAELSKTLFNRPRNTNRQPALVRMIGRLDQAQAAADEILSADAGQRLDSLAEVLGRLVEEMQDDVGVLLHSTNTTQGP
jgi:hypothetical protein